MSRDVVISCILFLQRFIFNVLYLGCVCSGGQCVWTNTEGCTDVMLLPFKL